MGIRLQGRDGKGQKVEIGTLVTGNGTLTLANNTYYTATNILTTGSGLPTGLTVQRPFKGATTIVPATGEKVYPLNATDMCDIASISIESKLDEIDETTLCDDNKVYDIGFADFTGSLEGSVTIGNSEALLNYGFDYAEQSADLETYTLTPKIDDVIYLKIELSKVVATGETQSKPEFSLYAPAKITSVSDGVKVGEKQTFSANFRITSDDYVKPTLLKILQAA